MSDTEVYVSITGLRLKNKWQFLPFWWHASRSFHQAARTPVNLRTEARQIGGVHHTLTVWQNESAMHSFLYSGAHKKAIKAFRRLASGKTFGFLTEKPPDWEQVPASWRKHGKDY